MNNTEKLVQLATKNPKLPIVFQVDNEVIPSDEYGWYLGSMRDCYVGEYALLNEMVVTDRDEYKERYLDYNYEEIDEKFPETDEDSDSALEEYLDKIADKQFIEAIIVSIVAE